jgi:hypothetical protein
VARPLSFGPAPSLRGTNRRRWASFRYVSCNSPLECPPRRHPRPADGGARAHAVGTGGIVSYAARPCPCHCIVRARPDAVAVVRGGGPGLDCPDAHRRLGRDLDRHRPAVRRVAGGTAGGQRTGLRRLHLHRPEPGHPGPGRGSAGARPSNHGRPHPRAARGGRPHPTRRAQRRDAARHRPAVRRRLVGHRAGQPDRQPTLHLRGTATSDSGARHHRGPGGHGGPRGRDAAARGDAATGGNAGAASHARTGGWHHDLHRAAGRQPVLDRLAVQRHSPRPAGGQRHRQPRAPSTPARC